MESAAKMYIEPRSQNASALLVKALRQNGYVLGEIEGSPYYYIYAKSKNKEQIEVGRTHGHFNFRDNRLDGALTVDLTTNEGKTLAEFLAEWNPEEQRE